MPRSCFWHFTNSFQGTARSPPPPPDTSAPSSATLASSPAPPPGGGGAATAAAGGGGTGEGTGDTGWGNGRETVDFPVFKIFFSPARVRLRPLPPLPLRARLREEEQGLRLLARGTLLPLKTTRQERKELVFLKKNICAITFMGKRRYEWIKNEILVQPPFGPSFWQRP